jgi:DNA-binding MarR family transcriptional regulator
MSEIAKEPAGGLDAVLHQPVRTRIVAYLVGRGAATFTELKRVLQASDGNLESHLKKLIAAEYVATRSDDSGSRPQTLYALTEAGRAALQTYTANLQALLGLGADSQSGALPLGAGKLSWDK